MHYLYIQSLLAASTGRTRRGRGSGSFQTNGTNLTIGGTKLAQNCNIHAYLPLTASTRLSSIQEGQFGTTSAHHAIIPAYTYRLEVIMDNFLPFVHKQEKKKEWEPEPLYIELYPPPPKHEEIEEKEDDNPTVIIIQL